MAGATGLEPATFGVTGRRSNQLSYAPAGGWTWRNLSKFLRREGLKSGEERGF